MRTYLGCVALSGDMTVIVATEALLDSAGAVVEIVHPESPSWRA